MSRAREEHTLVSGTVRADSVDALVTDVVEALADATGTAPTELGATLYDAVDPDALARLVATENSVERITFTLADCVVVIDGDQQVTVHRQRDGAVAGDD